MNQNCRISLITIAIIFAAAMAAASFPVTAAAASGSTLSPVIYPTGYIDPEIVIPVSSYPYNDYQFESGYGRAVSTENLPVSYDLRNYSRVSPLRNQYNYGSCWAFGTLGSVESNLLTDDAVKYAGIDLSERHLAYFSNHREEISSIANPLPRLEGLKGDFAYMNPQENYLNNGGNYLMTTFTLMSWIGAVNESDAAYISGDMPSLDASTAYDNDTVHVENVFWISMNDKNAVKAMIREYGGAFVAFNVNQTNPDYVKSLTENTVAYYQTAEIRTNHVVTLIGWDDNFAKEKFNTTPVGNGAWLVKNSWGEGPYSYAWISYYDTSISSSTSVACFFDAVDAAKYDNNYQYDGGWGGNCRSYTNTIAPRFISNVFTADSAETLKAVAFMTDQTDITYSVQIYLSPSDSSNPESGTPAFNEPQAGFNQYAGYVTIPMRQEVSLSAGQKFAVVINLSHQTEPVHIWIDTSADTTGRYISTYAEAGQSFIRGVNNDWTDVSADGKTNVRIKAFTNEVWSVTPVSNTTNSVNASTAAEIGYRLSPSFLGTVRAPVFTHGNNSIVLNETVVVKKFVGGVETEVPATVNSDGTVQITGDIDDADSITVTFVGRKIGDASGDGDVSIRDSVVISRYLAMLDPLDTTGQFYANLEGRSNGVKVIDCIKIARYKANILDSNFEEL